MPLYIPVVKAGTATTVKRFGYEHPLSRNFRSHFITILGESVPVTSNCIQYLYLSIYLSILVYWYIGVYIYNYHIYIYIIYNYHIYIYIFQHSSRDPFFSISTDGLTTVGRRAGLPDCCTIPMASPNVMVAAAASAPCPAQPENVEKT